MSAEPARVRLHNHVHPVRAEVEQGQDAEPRGRLRAQGERLVLPHPGTYGCCSLKEVGALGTCVGYTPGRERKRELLDVRFVRVLSLGRVFL